LLTNEIAANIERADKSIQASRQLCQSGFYDYAASRAYYSAFYAATALLLAEGLDFSKHSGVIASIHKQFVKQENKDSYLSFVQIEIYV
jgi:uncharacterized protein (UPF0332 family)